MIFIILILIFELIFAMNKISVDNWIRIRGKVLQMEKSGRSIII